MRVKELTDEELMQVVLAIRFTGICPSYFEKECLLEIVERFERAVNTYVSPCKKCEHEKEKDYCIKYCEYEIEKECD